MQSAFLDSTIKFLIPIANKYVLILINVDI
jgi:hypothetical protein